MLPRRVLPTFEHEERLWAEGHLRIAGLDEAGRGPLAGPVVAAAVIVLQGQALDPSICIADSKQLTPRMRERAAAALRQSFGYGLGAATVREIDCYGISAACKLAMIRAMAMLPHNPDALLIDAVKLPNVPITQRSIIHGDRDSWAIAAASIIAKVERDCLMESLDRAFPGYGLAKHKGYGTADHVDALRRLGPSPIHRQSFAPVALAWQVTK